MSTEITDNGTLTAHRVGSLAALRGGAAMKASVGGRKVALFLMDGDQVVATNGRCPHAAGPLHDGEVTGTMLTCPWHGWSFDLRTGICEEDPDLILERYPVRVEGDDILVLL